MPTSTDGQSAISSPGAETFEQDAAATDGKRQTPLWEQLPERCLAWFVQQNLPFEMVVTPKTGPEVTRRVDAVIAYPPTPGSQFVPTTEVCIDPGKFSNKAGGIQQREIIDIDGTAVERDAAPRFVFINAPVVYKPAQRASYSSGPGKSDYRILSTSAKHVEGTAKGSLLPEEAFTFGEDGMDKGDAIPVYNKFYQRWRLGRYRAIWYATITRTAMEIGLRPTPKMIEVSGQAEPQAVSVEEIPPHYIALTVALPDEELINQNGEMKLDPQTRAALEDSKGEFVVEWTDPNGTAWIFKFFVVKVDLIAQTHAAWMSVFNSIDASETPIIRQGEDGEALVFNGPSIIDEWGGGDRQRGTFEMVNGRLTMFASKIEEGTHTIAEALRTAVYRQFQVRPSLAQAQLALATGTIDSGGELLKVGHLVEQLRHSRFENLLTSALVTDEVRLKFWIHVGGAAALMQEELAAFILDSEVKPYRFLLAPKEVAPIMVLIGGWAWGYFRLKDDLRKLHAEFERQQELRSDLRKRLSLALNHLPVTNSKAAARHGQLQEWLRRVEEFPEWPGYLAALQEIDRNFGQLVPEQPWLKLS